MKVAPFTLHFYPSRYLLMYLFLLCFSVLLSLYYLPLDSLQFLSVSLLVIGICLRSFFSTKKVGQLVYRDQCWQLITGDKTVLADLYQATVWRSLVVMNFCAIGDGSKCSLILWPESAAKQQLRQLRVMLRHYPVYRDTII
ncbi:hypothetical protein [Oceanicoccus sp. KOV_DT_Chl]|uniref:hypothetical protein n=1 Tax=Oceanicoccus sp. KOV_DT_Chl TaxID=1904639 RepID=UPI0011AF6F49|nr:hypothetical protein [Oceanicoccus sp. KOV_DT_Chl]